MQMCVIITMVLQATREDLYLCESLFDNTLEFLKRWPFLKCFFSVNPFSSSWYHDNHRFPGSQRTASTRTNTESAGKRWPLLVVVRLKGLQLFRYAGPPFLNIVLHGTFPYFKVMSPTRLTSEHSRYGRCGDRLSGSSLKTPLFCRYLIFSTAGALVVVTV